MKKVGHTVDYIVSTIIEFLCFLVLITAGFFVIQSHIIGEEASADRYISTYKHLLEDEKTGRFTLSEMQKINPDTVAWLTIDNTPIDYPVLQDTEDYSYINRDFEGNTCLTGSLFINKTTNRYFEDTLSIIYGHHMTDGNMFGSIDYFEDPSYLQAHRTGTLVTEKQTYSVEVLALIFTDANNVALYSAHSIENLIADIKDTDDIKIRNGKVDLKNTKKVLLLSTCSSSGPTDRLLLVTRLTEI